MSTRAPAQYDDDPYVFMDTPVLRQLTFAPHPWETHPIDTYDGPQGWGPFYGAWTPYDFPDIADEISDGYAGSNEWEFAPDYNLLTLFEDHSLDFAWNTSYDVAMQHAENEDELAYTSTIANVVPQQQGMISRLRDMLFGTPQGGGSNA